MAHPNSTLQREAIFLLLYYMMLFTSLQVKIRPSYFINQHLVCYSLMLGPFQQPLQIIFPNTFPCIAHVPFKAVRCCFSSHSSISQTFFCELEIITRNRSLCPLLFLITKSKMILSKKGNVLQVCNSSAWETIPSDSQPHCALPGDGAGWLQQFGYMERKGH